MVTVESNVHHILKKVIELSPCQSGEHCADGFVGDVEFVKELLSNPEDAREVDVTTTKYPIKPYYRPLSQSIYKLYFDAGLFTSKDSKLGLNTKNHRFKDSTLINLQRLTDTEKTTGVLDLALLKSIFYSLRKWDVLVLLGFGRTEGSLDVLPPDISQLWQSFEAQHHPKSKLTVGARALTKHCNRSSELFWGVCTGTEANKNRHSLEILRKVLCECCWINVHTLPHQVFVLEIRNEAGYGMRWSRDGKSFRGFLEPQMENGHEVGWKH